MIVAFVQTKGGVGKTTLAVNTAVERVIRGDRDVLLVDADEQGTASDFAMVRTERLGHSGFTVVQLAGAAVRTQVLAMKKKFEDVVIDVGGRDTAGLRAALTVADVAVFPFQPRSFDVWTLGKASSLVSEARLVNPGLKAYAVINCADSQGDDNQAAAEVLTGDGEIVYLATPIGRRKAFPNSSALGLSVLEAPQKDRKACTELQAMVNGLMGVIGGWKPRLRKYRSKT